MKAGIMLIAGMAAGSAAAVALMNADPVIHKRLCCDVSKACRKMKRAADSVLG